MVYQKRNSTDSFHSTISTTDKVFKNDLMESIGGETQFKFLVISFCEKIAADKSLKLFYGGLGMSSLVALQKDMLLWAFLDVSPEESNTIRGKLILKHHLMMQKGFSEDHFKMLEKHFTNAMLEVWLDKHVMDLCSKYFKDLRSVFDGCKDFEMQAALEEDEMVDTLVTSFKSSILSSIEFSAIE